MAERGDGKLRRWLVFGLLTSVAVAAMRRVSRHALARDVPGGVLMGDSGGYDTMSRVLLGSFFAGIASNIAQKAEPGSKILEVGCGPGQLAVRLARDHGLDVTGVDLDPEMVDRATQNADREVPNDAVKPRFVAADVASLPFAGGSFDLVVSTMSMHHWADPRAGLGEIARVLRPTGIVLVWDLKQGVPLHGHAPDPVQQVAAGPLRLVETTPWKWPWRFSFSQRLELTPA